MATLSTLDLATAYIRDNMIFSSVFVAVNRSTSEIRHYSSRTDCLLDTNADWDRFTNSAVGVEKCLTM